MLLFAVSSILNILVGLTLVLYGGVSSFRLKGKQRNTVALGVLAICIVMTLIVSGQMILQWTGTMDLFCCLACNQSRDMV